MTDIDPEELFPPVPGGMVDTVRRQRAAEDAQLAAMPQPVDGLGGVRMDVPVTELGAELGRSRTFSVATGNNNPVVQLLGRDDNRRYAVLLTLQEPVVISFSQQSADDPRNQAYIAGASANGFVLPVGVPVPVSYKGVIWCTATSATPTSVSVMAFSNTER